MSKIETLKEGIHLASVLSLASAILILVGSAFWWFWYPSIFGSMMGNWGWMMSSPNVVTMLPPMTVIGMISGVVVLISAIMMSLKPHEGCKWGLLVLIFSSLSLLGMGGFLVGSALGIAGGALAMTSKR